MSYNYGAKIFIMHLQETNKGVFGKIYTKILYYKYNSEEYYRNHDKNLNNITLCIQQNLLSYMYLLYLKCLLECYLQAWVNHIIYIFWHIHELSYQHVYFVGCVCYAYADGSLNYNEKVLYTILSWHKGLTTGIYYCHTKRAQDLPNDIIII